MTETYSIKDVADYFNLSISTIRYYDKKGLLPFVAKNDSGYRVFTRSDMALIQTIVCLKNTGMPIKDIKQYIEYCMAGTSTIPQRRTLLIKHKRQVIQQQQILAENLKEIDTKITRYASDNAEDIIGEQIKYMEDEKKSLNLPDPFYLK